MAVTNQWLFLNDIFIEHSFIASKEHAFMLKVIYKLRLKCWITKWIICFIFILPFQYYYLISMN